MAVYPFATIPQEPSGNWAAAGHEIPFDTLNVAGIVAAWILLALFVLVVARAILVRHRYRADLALSEAEREDLKAAIREAERRTVGEVTVVVLGRSDRHPGADWLAAVFVLLLGSALLAGFLPWERPALLLACQVLLGGVGFACARVLPDFKRRFVSESRATEMANEQALQEFYSQGLHRTEAATGVLLFVSLLERRAVVLGDTGIDAKVGAEHWKHTTEAVLKGLRAGSLRQGLEDGLRSCADVLAEHFPWVEGDRNELPDHVEVRPE